MSNQKAVNYTGPFITMVVLMSLVGFLTVLNQQFQAPLQGAFLNEAGDLKNTLATLITFAFFLAYLVMGSTGASLVEKKGYRGTLFIGLIVLIFGLGTFEISALFHQHVATTVMIGSATIPVAYFIFLLGSFVVGTAMTFLQVAVNPYIVACDVKGTSGVQRQTIAGAGNSTMSTLAPILVSAVIFGGLQTNEITIDMVYLPFAILMGLVFILAMIVKRANLPQIASIATGENEVYEKSVWSFSHLKMGVLAIFVYVGVEVAVGANIVLYGKSLGGTFAERAAFMASLYWGGMLLGRLCGSFLSKVPAKTQLIVTSIGAGILTALAMLLSNPWLLVGVGIFHSIMWPAIFSMAIDKLGKYTSKASGALMLGVVGGAIFPLVQGVLADQYGWDYTWVIVLLGEVYLLYYALVGSKVKQTA